MSYRILDLKQGSQEWKEARFDHLTASQAPILFEQSPHQTRLQLFHEKVSRKEREVTQKQSTLFDIGHSAEVKGREYIRSSLKLALEPAVLESKEVPDILASLDGFDAERGIIFEAKYVGAEALDDVRRGKLKPHHETQVQAQLYVSNATECIYFALDPRGEAAICRIRPDYALQKEIIREAVEFMAAVRSGTEPEPGPRDYVDIVDSRLERMAELKALIEANRLGLEGLEEELTKLKDEVVSQYTESRIRGSGLTLVRSVRRGSVDYKRIPQLRGVDLDRYRAAAKEVVTLKWEKK
jgi:putative phage-type endonuclease